MMDAQVLKKLEEYFQKFTTKKYSRHELLIGAGDTPPGLFCLKNGVVRQFAITKTGEEITINIFKPFALFPVAWIVNDTLSPHYFEAMTEVTVCVSPKKDALYFLKSESSVLFDLIRRIYRGLDGLFMRLESSMSGDSRARLITELLIISKRFGNTESSLKLTHKELATMSGIARETVSRELSKLRKQGLIDYQKNVLTIRNANKLEEELLRT